MEAYLAEEEIPHERIASSLHRACLDTKVTPVLCGSSFKNKGVQPLLDAIVELLPSPLEVPPVTGVVPAGKGQEEADRGRAPRRRRRALRRARLQGDDRPLRRQAHLLPRLLGQARSRRPRPQRLHRQDRADRAAADDARQQPRGDRGVLRGRHLRRGRPQGNRHRRHAGRPRCADRAGEHRIPGAGDRGRDRAEDESRPGEDGHRPAAPRRGGPDLPGSNPTRKPARP